MSIRKILFSGSEGSANIEGLIESLKKTSPGTLAALKDGGGRIMGEAMADDNHGGSHANDSRITSQQKI